MSRILEHTEFVSHDVQNLKMPILRRENYHQKLNART